MKRKNTARSALFTSIISLLLCVTMLVGATFAWFTDKVESGINTIAAGNLDVELEYYDGSAWKTVNGATKLFTGNLWEPGHTEVVYLKLSNLGSLALKYHLGINIVSETEGTNVAGETFKLSDHIYMGVVENAAPTYTSRDDAIKAAKGGTNGIIGAGFAKSGFMTADAADLYLAVVVYMPESVGNEANYMTGTARPEINLGINLFATQLEYESDSFGPDYDRGAAWAGEVGKVPAEVDGVITITSAGELAGLAADVNSGNNYEGKTIKLGANIDLNDIAWTPIGNSANKFNGTFIGTGYTISNLRATGSKGVGLFGYTWTSAHIEGVTIDGAVVSGNDYVGAILGNGYLSANCIKDCTVKNAEITATPYLMDNGSYDGGAKAGAIAGSAYNGNLTGNKAINCKITAYRDLGGIAGMLYADGVTGRTLTASGNTVENVTLSYLDLNGAAYDGNKVNENMGDVVGRIGRSSEKCNMPTVENNTAENVTRNTLITWIDNGVQYTKTVDTGVVTLFLITDAFTDSTLNVPNGVTNLRNKLLSGNTTIKEVVLPATVTNFGGAANGTEAATGGFFYKSAVEKITLPEGLTEIPAGAFNQAASLKEVNIPSTVTTIGIGAFGGSGLAELTIPATVTTIGGGAFRDMANLTTVTINGSSINIPKYAFRNCAKLTTVILNVDSLTLGDGMIFTNSSSNNENPNKITIYVKNDSVSNTLTSNKDVKCAVVKADYFAFNAAELQAALDAATDNATIVLGADITGNVTASQKEGVNITVDGAGHQYNGTIYIHGNARYTGAETLTIRNINFVADKGMDFVSSNETGSVERYAHNVTIEDCAFTSNSEDDVVAARFRQSYNIVIKDCTATNLHSVLWATGGSNITVDNVTASCTSGGVSFGTSTPAVIKNSNITVAGEYGYGVRMDASGAYVLTVENCTITADAPVLLRKATGATTATLTGNTLNSDKGNTLMVIANDYEAGKELAAPTGKLSITVDGTPWVCNADQLAAAVAAGATNIYLLGGEYDVDLYGISKRDSLTIVGQGAATTLKFSNQQVRASQFDNLTISNCTIERMPDKKWGHLVFGSSEQAGGVYTISNCIFNGVGSQGIYINQNVAATFNIEDCTFNGDFGGEGAITIQNNDNVDVTVNVTGCTFNNIPEGSHEIFVIYAYDGWTLNADGVNAYWKANQ